MAERPGVRNSGRITQSTSTPMNSIRPKLANKARNTEPMGITSPTGIASLSNRNGPMSPRHSQALPCHRPKYMIVPIAAPQTFATDMKTSMPLLFHVPLIKGIAAPTYMTARMKIFTAGIARCCSEPTMKSTGTLFRFGLSHSSLKKNMNRPNKLKTTNFHKAELRGAAFAGIPPPQPFTKIVRRRPFAKNEKASRVFKFSARFYYML